MKKLTLHLATHLVLGELILLYYLRIFSVLILIFIYFVYLLFFRIITLKSEYVLIEKNNNYNLIISQNINDHKINLIIFKTVLRSLIMMNNTVHYGKFKLKNDGTFIDFLSVIKKPSNISEKITIVEGWSKQKLNQEFKNHFKNFDEIEYTEIIADTYFFNSGSSFLNLKKKFKTKYDKVKEKYINNELLKKFTFNEVMIIGSLLEKEGIDELDKKKIFSVIINRLEKKMKLQIDATVIYALTDGKNNLNRKLKYDDLKIKNEFNTYYVYGLPPRPISYIGNKTIELIFENYKSDYLFYFYDKNKNDHIYSKNYKNHLKKLNEYRQKK